MEDDGKSNNHNDAVPYLHRLCGICGSGYNLRHPACVHNHGPNASHWHLEALGPQETTKQHGNKHRGKNSKRNF